jgi:hypothetical protein
LCRKAADADDLSERSVAAGDALALRHRTYIIPPSSCGLGKRSMAAVVALYETVDVLH